MVGMSIQEYSLQGLVPPCPWGNSTKHRDKWIQLSFNEHYLWTEDEKQKKRGKDGIHCKYCKKGPLWIYAWNDHKS